jgi:hypothetical protein
MGVRLQWVFGPVASAAGLRRAPREEHHASAGQPQRPGLGSALALTGFLAAARIAETATGVVLSAAEVLSGPNTSSKQADAAPGGE